MEEFTKRFVGTWQLVHAKGYDSAGRVEYPYGEDAVGYIIYGDNGIMAVQISRNVRNGNGDLPSFRRDYMAYFGRYEIDTKKGVVRHFLEAQLFPDQHPLVLERKYTFDGDLLFLVPLEGADREILWRRVR